MSKKEWVTWKIPLGSDIHKLVENNPDSTPWKTLTGLLEHQPKSKEEQSIKLFEQFIEDINKLYPGSNDKLEQLRPLIFIKLLKNTDIDDSYYNLLKDL